MSMAPWWCGTIMATKSLSTSLDGLIFIAAIILAIAALLLAKNGASTGPGDRQAAALRRTRANTAIPRPARIDRFLSNGTTPFCVLSGTTLYDNDEASWKRP